jgi:hypothetical protein
VKGHAVSSLCFSYSKITVHPAGAFIKRELEIGNWKNGIL